MRTEKKTDSRKRRRLAGEILEFLLVSFAISAFTFCFLFFTSESLADTWLSHLGILPSASGQAVLKIWLCSLCLTACIVIFLFLFLFLLGQRIAYLLNIIRGVDTLQASRMDSTIPLEGNDELTELAERINVLAASEKELAAKEQKMQEEKNAWVRSLSHDIRTPLTSVISYTQLLQDRDSLTEKEMRDYLRLMQIKTEQIRELTDRLLGREVQNPEPVEHIRLLMEQLAAEWEESLEERFLCRAELSGLSDFSGMADIYALRRIFDNLASNTEKYADPQRPVELQITGQENRLTITQKNGIGRQPETVPESSGIGLNSIRRIAADYGGTLEVQRNRQDFTVKISLSLPPCL